MGGDSPGMENAHAIIRNSLQNFWIRRMTIEAARWHNANRSLSDVEQARNCNAIVDCISQCSLSTYGQRCGAERPEIEHLASTQLP